MIEWVLFAILFLFTGMATGILSALFGIGGGLTMVPVLYLFFKYYGLPLALNMHMAVGTSLAVMVISSMNASFQHYRAGHVIWPAVIKMAPILAVGALCGALSSRYIHSDILRYFFIAFLIFTVIKALFKKSFTQKRVLSEFQLPAFYKTGPVCFITGLISVWLGISGSVVTVPFLRGAKMPMVNATSAGVTMAPAVAILGVIGYIIAGWQAPDLPPESLGFIYGPAFLGMTLGSLAGVPIGAYISHKISDRLLARSYIAMLIIVLIMMIA